MTGPFTLEAQVTDGPLIGRRLVVTWTYPDLRNSYPVTTARVEIEDRMVPLDIARTVLAHTERTAT